MARLSYNDLSQGASPPRPRSTGHTLFRFWAVGTALGRMLLRHHQRGRFPFTVGRMGSEEHGTVVKHGEATCKKKFARGLVKEAAKEIASRARVSELQCAVLRAAKPRARTPDEGNSAEVRKACLIKMSEARSVWHGTALSGSQKFRRI